MVIDQHLLFYQLLSIVELTNQGQGDLLVTKFQKCRC